MWPTGHSVQLLDCSAAAKRPGKHVVQADAVVLDQLPAGQSVQAAVPLTALCTANRPAPHAGHTEAAAWLAKVPEGHPAQLVAPVAFWKNPTSQEKQLERPFAGA